MLDKKQHLKSRRSVDLRIAHIDVRGGQDGEDVSLQAGDQRLEQEHEHASREGDDAERHHQLVHHINEEELRGREAQRKDQVARNHVGEQSDRQRERADNQQLKQLNRGQQTRRISSDLSKIENSGLISVFSPFASVSLFVMFELTAAFSMRSPPLVRLIISVLKISRSDYRNQKLPLRQAER